MTARTRCRFTFEGSPIFEGFTNGTHWNGWPNVWVRPDVAAAVAKWSREEGDDETADEIAAKAPDGDGLISLAYGFTPTLERRFTTTRRGRAVAILDHSRNVPLVATLRAGALTSRDDFGAFCARMVEALNALED